MGSGYFSSQTFSRTIPHILNAVTLHTFSPMKMEQAECSETLAFKLQTPGNNPKENIRHFRTGSVNHCWSNVAVVPLARLHVGEWRLSADTFFESSCYTCYRYVSIWRLERCCSAPFQNWLMIPVPLSHSISLYLYLVICLTNIPIIYVLISS
jgi:hypothetical protein